MPAAVIAVPHPTPVAGPLWRRDQPVRVLAGCYETEPPRVREVYAAAQVGRVVGWRYAAWEGRGPTGAVVYVRVEAAG